ncbi:Stromelysin-1 [Dactylellina cionopaga]|nr:Stromelysin-1 [Dactylellina cionopaga]
MCGIYDEKNPQHNAAVHKRQYGDQRWPGGYTFQYRVEGVLPGSDVQTMEAAFERAFSKWAQYVPYKFQKASGNDANLTISVTPGYDQFFQSNPSTQAYSNIGPAGRNGQSYVRFKGPAFRQWTPEAIHTLFLHEFGHVLGLQHSQNQNAIMYPFISNMFSERQLTPDDTSRIQSIVAGLGAPTGGNNNYNNQPQNNQPQNNYNNQPQNNYNNQPQNNYNNQPQNNYNQPQNNYNNPQNNYNRPRGRSIQTTKRDLSIRPIIKCGRNIQPTIKRDHRIRITEHLELAAAIAKFVMTRISDVRLGSDGSDGATCQPVK